jgi:hypothetical protein
VRGDTRQGAEDTRTRKLTLFRVGFSFHLGTPWAPQRFCAL